MDSYKLSCVSYIHHFIHCFLKAAFRFRYADSLCHGAHHVRADLPFWPGSPGKTRAADQTQIRSPSRIQPLNPKYKEHIKNFTKEFSKNINYNRIKYSLYKKLDEHLSHVLWMMKNPEKPRYNKKRLYWAMRVYN